MTQSIVRYLVVALMTYLVNHHVITQEIADANVAAWVNFIIFWGSLAGVLLWSFLEKRYKGVLSAYFPASTLGPTPPTAKLLPFALALGAGAWVLIPLLT